jgi:predicted nucleic acid-binding protein
MIKKPIRIYADTSVFGGVFDEEFKEPSRTFFSQVRNGRFALVLSAVVRRELEGAPTEVRGVYDEFLSTAEFVDTSDQALRLQDAYLAAEIVSPQRFDDALHVALARCRVVRPS